MRYRQTQLQSEPKWAGEMFPVTRKADSGPKESAGRPKPPKTQGKGPAAVTKKPKASPDQEEEVVQMASSRSVASASQSPIKSNAVRLGKNVRQHPAKAQKRIRASLRVYLERYRRSKRAAISAATLKPM